jgi:hypothetical protein
VILHRTVSGPGLFTVRYKTAKSKGVSVTVEKVPELREIMSYGVMSTPGVVIDGKVVHAGGVPSREKVEQWLATWGVEDTL